MSNVSGLFKDLTTIKKARNGRLASWDQRGKNQDYWEIPAGETISLGEIEGPGCITHIWMTSSCRKVVAPSILDPVLNASAAPVMEIHPALGVIWDDYDPFYYRKVLIKITWDDQDTPSVLAPLGDFFCIGNCYPGNFSSLPFNVSLKPEEAGRYGAPCSVSCYFPMPFNKKAKIEIVNENELPFILYFNIDYEMYKEALDEDTAYFHASWRRENPCKGWGPDLQTNCPEVNNVTNFKGEDNYTVLDVEGTGHYVGCNLTVKHYQGSWWGEGNDMFFIDGEEKKGATTIWEHWDGLKPDGSMWSADMNSFNHYAYGAIGEWMYRVMAGLEVDEAATGFKHAVFYPRIGGNLTYTEGRYHSIYGEEYIRWEVEQNEVKMKVKIPANTTASIRLDMAEEIVDDAGLDFEKKDGYMEAQSGSGEYIICYRRA